MHDVKTRPAKLQDIDMLAEMFLAAMREAITSARGYWDLAREHAQFRQQLEIDGARVLSLENVDVGFVVTRRVAVGTVKIHTLCVAQSAQGRGIGAWVMRDLMRDAEASAATLELSVLRANPRARTFYERLGFVEVGQSLHHTRMQWPQNA